MESRRANETVFPPLPDLFAALRLSSFDRARVLILGQDPYHRAGRAHGLSFERPARSEGAVVVAQRCSRRCVTASESRCRAGGAPARHWAEQGGAAQHRADRPRGQAGVARRQGLGNDRRRRHQALNARPDPVVFLLWGAHAPARKVATGGQPAARGPRGGFIPSPMNPRGFLGGRFPFSAAQRRPSPRPATPHPSTGPPPPACPPVRKRPASREEASAFCALPGPSRTAWIRSGVPSCGAGVSPCRRERQRHRGGVGGSQRDGAEVRSVHQPARRGQMFQRG